MPTTPDQYHLGIAMVLPLYCTLPLLSPPTATIALPSPPLPSPPKAPIAVNLHVALFVLKSA